MKKIIFRSFFALCLSFVFFSCEKSELSELSEKSSTESISKSITNEYDYVDLGLPSGVLWAACNVGANKPEEYGDHYSWGEIETKKCYDYCTYKWSDGTPHYFTKYCTDSEFGNVDGLTTLELSDDVAHVKMGGDWRMPTLTEIEELIENCDWKLSKVGCTFGFAVTGPNGNFIFLPFAGDYVEKKFYCDNLVGSYWSSTGLKYYQDCGQGFNISANGLDEICYERFRGFTVRAVKSSHKNLN